MLPLGAFASLEGDWTRLSMPEGGRDDGCVPGGYLTVEGSASGGGDAVP